MKIIAKLALATAALSPLASFGQFYTDTQSFGPVTAGNDPVLTFSNFDLSSLPSHTAISAISLSLYIEKENGSITLDNENDQVVAFTYTSTVDALLELTTSDTFVSISAVSSVSDTLGADSDGPADFVGSDAGNFLPVPTDASDSGTEFLPSILYSYFTSANGSGTFDLNVLTENDQDLATGGVAFAGLPPDVFGDATVDIYIEAIPEPSTYVAGIAGLLLAGIVLVRRRAAAKR